ncbi:hypothetical protein OH76DRAFT_1424306, partial [Lentinus brumalis]
MSLLVLLTLNLTVSSRTPTRFKTLPEVCTSVRLRTLNTFPAALGLCRMQSWQAHHHVPGHALYCRRQAETPTSSTGFGLETRATLTRRARKSPDYSNDMVSRRDLRYYFLTFRASIATPESQIALSANVAAGRPLALGK